MPAFFIDCHADHVGLVITSLNNAMARSVRIAYSEDDTEACIMYMIHNVGTDGHMKTDSQIVGIQDDFVSTMKHQFQIEYISLQVFDDASEERQNFFRSSKIVYDKGLPIRGDVTALWETEGEDEKEDEDEDEDGDAKAKDVKCPNCGILSTPDDVRFKISISMTNIEYLSGTVDINLDENLEIDPDGDWNVSISDNVCEHNDTEHHDGPNVEVVCKECEYSSCAEGFNIYDISVI